MVSPSFLRRKSNRCSGRGRWSGRGAHSSQRSEWPRDAKGLGEVDSRHADRSEISRDFPSTPIHPLSSTLFVVHLGAVPLQWYNILVVSTSVLLRRRSLRPGRLRRRRRRLFPTSYLAAGGNVILFTVASRPPSLAPATAAAAQACFGTSPPDFTSHCRRHARGREGKGRQKRERLFVVRKCLPRGLLLSQPPRGQHVPLLLRGVVIEHRLGPLWRRKCARGRRAWEASSNLKTLDMLRNESC